VVRTRAERPALDWPNSSSRGRGELPELRVSRSGWRWGNKNVGISELLRLGLLTGEDTMSFVRFRLLEFPADVADLSDRPEFYRAHPTGGRHTADVRYSSAARGWACLRRRATANSNNQADHTTRLVGFPHVIAGKQDCLFGNFERGEGRVCRGASLPNRSIGLFEKNFQKFWKIRNLSGTDAATVQRAASSAMR